MHSIHTGLVLAMFGFLGNATCLMAVEPTKDSLDTVKRHLENKRAVMVDVRDDYEWKAGHLRDAKHVAVPKIRRGLSQEELDRLAPGDTILYLYCAAGVRSLMAAEMLEQCGKDVRALKAGYEELVRNGFPKADE